MYRNVIVFFLLVTLANTYIINEEECLNYTIYPVQYEIIIKPYIFTVPYDRIYYDCDIIITVIANVPGLDIIELDAKDLNIKGDSIRVLEGSNNLVNKHRPYEYDSRNGKIRILLKETLKEYRVYGTQYQIKMSFTKFVKFDTSGVFVVRYDDDQPRYLIMTRLSPNKAKYFFPCIYNPQFESVFKFKVYEAPAHSDLQYTDTSLVIAKEQSQNRQKDNYVVIDYLPSSQVGLYQVGFHYSQFKSREVKSKYTNDTLVIWAPASKLQQYTFILEFGESIINLIHDYSSKKQPLVNGPINIVAVPSNLDGYEVASWNLLTNGDTKLAYVQDATSIKQLEKMTFELTQQLCRIWLGNPGETERTRWKEEWFKEGVATYLAYYFLTQYNHGSQSMMKRQPIGMYGLEMKQKAMAVDWHHSNPALITFNRTLAVEIPPRYKELVTMKTAAILWMVENWIGSDKFHNALVKYINSRRGKYISLADFQASLDLDTVECEQQFLNGLTASNVLNSWFHRSGYPVVNVQVLRDRTPNAVHLTQRQFSFTSENRMESNYLIPISYVVQNNENCFNCYRPRFTISNTYTFEENLNNGWIILNRNASDYYRVNYDVTTWKLIAKSLKDNLNAIGQQDRAQIVNDVLALYAAGDMDFYLAMEILDYLHNEPSHIVWKSVISGFNLLKTEHAGCNMSKAVYEQWKEFMRNKVSAVYNRLVNDIEQQLQTRLFRSNIVEFAAAIDYQPCLENLRQMYEKNNYGNYGLEPDSRQACYYMLVKEDIENIGKRNYSQFEQEDLSIAKERVREENRFQYLIPKGLPKPSRIESSTLPTPIESVTEQYIQSTTPSASVLVAASSFTMFITAFAAAAIR